MWVNVDVAFDALLTHVGPRVPTHPLPLTLGTLVFPEAALLPLVRSQTFTFGPGLQTHRAHKHPEIMDHTNTPYTQTCVTYESLLDVPFQNQWHSYGVAAPLCS